MEPIEAGLVTDALILLGTNVTLWILSVWPVRKTWPVDFVWSGFPPIMCFRIMLGNNSDEGSSCSAGARARQLVVTALVAIWGTRLTLNFVARGGVGHEDWRYTDMRKQFGKHFWWVSLFSVFLGQTVFLFGGCLSLYNALLRQESAFPLAQEIAGALICAFAVLLETVADVQMDFFRAKRREKRTDKLTIDTGVWRWSRHPNYFGELSWWWGLYVMSCGSSQWEAAWWVLLGPVAMTVLFAFVSIKLMEDRMLAGAPDGGPSDRADAFRAYRREVGSALVLVPPFLGKRIGVWWYGSDGSKDRSSSSVVKVGDSDGKTETRGS